MSAACPHEARGFASVHVVGTECQWDVFHMPDGTALREAQEAADRQGSVGPNAAWVMPLRPFTTGGVPVWLSLRCGSHPEPVRLVMVAGSLTADGVNL